MWRRVDPAVPEWAVTDYLLARIAEGVEHDAWLLAAVNSPRNKQPAHPKPIPRPGSQAEETKPKTDWRAQWREEARRAKSH